MDLNYWEEDEEFDRDDDMSIYNKGNREEALENDEIADWEEAIMMGWDEAI
ncbi:hypothetical protein HYV81_04105 [Candidatus Woesearchaeota archaeon]|nr:hypothetical protein [Candidatus Woesearchaeota archaeon]